MSKKVADQIILERIEKELKDFQVEIFNEVFDQEEIKRKLGEGVSLDVIVANSTLSNFGEKLYMLNIATSIIENSLDEDIMKRIFRTIPDDQNLLGTVADWIPNDIEDAFSDVVKATLHNLEEGYEFED